MRFLENMKVGSKIILLSCVFLVFMSAIAAGGVLSLRIINGELDILYTMDMQGVSAAKEANIQFLAASRAIRNMALFAAKKDMQAVNRYAASFDEVIKFMRAQLDAVAKSVTGENSRRVLAAALSAEQKAEVMQRAIIKNTLDGAGFNFILDELVKARVEENKADDLLTDLTKAMDEEAHNRAIESDKIYTRALYISFVLLGTALILGILLGVIVKRAIADPLVSVAGKAAKVAGGDLNQEFNFQRSDEIGTLSGALERMVANLRARITEAEQKSREAEVQTQKAMTAMNEANAAQEKAEVGQQAILKAAENVEQVVNRLSAASEELSAQVEECSRGTDMQRDRVASSATAMEEMNSTVLEVARNAGVASEGSERAKIKAQQGEAVVQKSVEAISAVQADTQILKKNMEGLGHQAEAIGTIMTVISDIADQTNLLALNAAIEAARAGEAGRGFAVVADEVRKLAEKTMNATKEVGDAIKGIQDGTRQSTSAVERTTGNLDATTDLVRKSGEALSDIVHEVVLTSDQVRAIATAAEEQSAASEEITHSLEEINRMAGEAATVMQQSAAAVSELAEQSRELQRLVNELRKG